MSTVGQQVVELQLAVLRAYPEYRIDTDAAQRELLMRADQAFASLEAECVLEGRAVILMWRTSTPCFDDAQRMRIELAIDDEEARRWVSAQLQELAPLFDPSLELLLDVPHRALLPALAEVGLETRMTKLHGDPVAALQGLRSGPVPHTLDGLRIEPLREERHIEPIVTLYRDWFARRPELGILSPVIEVTPDLQQRLDDMSRTRLRQSMEAGHATVVLRGENVLGHGGFVERDDPLLGRVGGLAICLHSDAQGRGVGKLVYSRLLERMIERDVRVMAGRTANPAVLHLAERMRRPVRGWQLEPSAQ